jgi:trk system potassium uptake protein TrkA
VKRQLFGVIGLGRFGSAISTTLAQLGHDVIGVDSNEDNVRQMADVVSQAIQLDATDARALRAAGIADVNVAAVSIGENIESSLLAVMLLHELGVRTVVAKAVTPLHGRILERLGVSRVIFPERDMAIRLAHSLVMPNVLDYVELSRDFSFVELPAPAVFVGQTLRQLELRPKHGLTLIAIKRRAADGNEVTNVAPSAEEVLQKNDILVLLGSNAKLADFGKLLEA